MTESIIASASHLSLDQVTDTTINIQEKLSEVVSSGPTDGSLGKDFIAKLSELGNSMSNTKAELQERLNIEGINSPTDLLSLQMDLYKITLQTELVAKGVSKNNQNLDTLMKAQ